MFSHQNFNWYYFLEESVLGINEGIFKLIIHSQKVNKFLIFSIGSSPIQNGRCPLLVYSIIWFSIKNIRENIGIRLMGYQLSKSNTCIMLTCLKKNDNFTQETGYS